MSTTAQQQELDALASLEERIRGAVELVSSLRSQNRDLESRLSSALQERDSVRQELDDLRSERKQVRTRIEKLLGQLDLLSST
jgi:FtsZ-binding cell division protein ZapB